MTDPTTRGRSTKGALLRELAACEQQLAATTRERDSARVENDVDDPLVEELTAKLETAEQQLAAARENGQREALFMAKEWMRDKMTPFTSYQQSIRILDSLLATLRLQGEPPERTTETKDDARSDHPSGTSEADPRGEAIGRTPEWRENAFAGQPGGAAASPCNCGQERFRGGCVGPSTLRGGYYCRLQVNSEPPS